MMELLTWLAIGLVGITATLSLVSIATIVSLVIGQAGLQMYRKLIS